MRKIIKNASRVIFSLLLIVSIFGAINVLAEEVIFQITKIEVKEKSDKVTVNDVSLSGGAITNDIVFTDKDDYITYNITIKNNTSDKYKIKSISDDNTSQYLKYTYDDLSNVELNAGDEKTFNMTITYIQETTDLTITDKAVSLTLTYEKEDGTTGTETITNPDNNATSNNSEVKGASETITNPKTGDNITLYIILGLISVTGLVITSVSKKHLSKSLMVVAIASSVLLPLGVKADGDKYVISFATNKVQNSYTELINGPEFNMDIIKLSLGDNLEQLYDDEYGYYYINNNYPESDDKHWIVEVDDVTAIKHASVAEFREAENTLTSDNIVSTDNSTVPVYVWVANNILYYYTTSNTIYLDADSNSLFEYYQAAKTIDVSKFDTSRVTDMSYMFGMCESLEELDLSNFDTSNVTKMSGLFSINESLKRVNLSSFDTSNVVAMDDMFGMCESLEELDLSNFDTRKVKTMNAMFSGLASENIDLTYLDTSNVEDMRHMFYEATVSTLDLSSFDTNKVTDMRWMFGANWESHYLKTIYVSDKFVTSSIQNNDGFNYVFQNVNGLVGGAGTKNTERHYKYTYARIDGGPSNPGFFTDIADKPNN